KRWRKWRWGSEKRKEALAPDEACTGRSPDPMPPTLRPYFPGGCGCQQRRHRGSVVSARGAGPTGVVAYASRSLSRAERSYCATRRELLALVWATHHFRPYLYDRKFTARTDHNSLKRLQNFREPEGQVACWLEKLAEFDFEVVHRPRKRHQNADALSRRACRQCGSGDD
ncbi:transposon Ty3-I Gag-Pol poly protein, partial [Trichinella spiralis]|uniref:transposon Ty3-I Gag-Pol poly protein n=1 Tax=Trichinella spiralis TaxID=6334 RepID=UPI0001EFEFF4